MSCNFFTIFKDKQISNGLYILFNFITKFGNRLRALAKNSPINAGKKSCFIALLFALARRFPVNVP